jgi:hypothetical protein
MYLIDAAVKEGYYEDRTSDIYVLNDALYMYLIFC